MRLGYRLPVDEHLPAGERMQAGHRPEQRGLAASGWSEHANQLALAHVEGNAFKGVDDAGARAVVLGRVHDADFDRRLLLLLEITTPLPLGCTTRRQFLRWSVTALPMFLNADR